jgi:hypothetical protein
MTKSLDEIDELIGVFGDHAYDCGELNLNENLRDSWQITDGYIDLISAIRELCNENERLKAHKKPWIRFEDEMPNLITGFDREYFVCAQGSEYGKTVFRTKFPLTRKEKLKRYQKELISYGWTHWKEIDEPPPPED